MSDWLGLVSHYQRRLIDNPNDGAALLGLAEVSLRLGDGAGAEQLCRHALGLFPTLDGAWLVLARALRANGQSVAALEALENLLNLNPQDHNALLELAYLHRRADQLDDALTACDRLVMAHPEAAIGWLTRGTILHQMADFDAAQASYRRALENDPTNAAASTFLGYTLLLQGYWAEGWAAFEARRQLPDRVLSPIDAPTLPLLAETETEATPGSVLVWNDQGHGDALMGLRFVPWLQERGFSPIVRLDSALAALSPLMTVSVPIISTTDPLPPVDYQVTLGSLPHCLGVTGPAGTWRGPLISVARPPAVSSSALPTATRRVGVVWAGSAGHENDFRRSLTIGHLAPLFEMGGITWVNLQVGPRRGEAEAVYPSVAWESPSPTLQNFADTARLMAGLDLVISVDTAVLHLAGNMGLAAWGLLATPSDWRWQCTGDDTAWYPSLRLFRQPTSGDWSSVVLAVREALLTP